MSPFDELMKVVEQLNGEIQELREENEELREIVFELQDKVADHIYMKRMREHYVMEF